MKSDSLPVESGRRRSRFTTLFACISEEDEGYTIQVRLTNDARPDQGAWGEEIAVSFETASTLVASLAAEFSIPQTKIRIEIRMQNIADGTRH